MTQSYAGDVTPTEAWQSLETEPNAVLVDVRTQPEWNYVGLPDLSRLGKSVLRVQWQTWPEGTLNPRFVEELAEAGVTPEHKVLLLCRSGARSKSAAVLLTQQGFGAAYNISDGFEGPHDAEKHRGSVAGWKHDALPWVQG
jgi:rhodanese-related sulfurtransferase